MTAALTPSTRACRPQGNDPAVALTLVELYFDLFRALLAQGPQARVRAHCLLAPLKPGNSSFPSFSRARCCSLSGGGCAQGDGAAGDASFKGKGQHASGKPLAAKKQRHDAARREQEKKRRAAHDDPAAAPRKPASASALSVDSRLLSALLTGINRAFPFVDADKVDSLVERVAPHVFRIAHAQSLHGAVQALTLLFQMMTARSASSDRFYRALYEVQLARAPTGTPNCTHHHPPTPTEPPTGHPTRAAHHPSLCPLQTTHPAPLRPPTLPAEPGPAPERLRCDVPLAAVQGAQG